MKSTETAIGFENMNTQTRISDQLQRNAWESFISKPYCGNEWKSLGEDFSLSKCEKVIDLGYLTDRIETAKFDFNNLIPVFGVAGSKGRFTQWYLVIDTHYYYVGGKESESKIQNYAEDLKWVFAKHLSQPEDQAMSDTRSLQSLGKSALKQQAIDLGVYTKIGGKAPTKEMLIEMIHNHLISSGSDTATVIDTGAVAITVNKEYFVNTVNNVGSVDLLIEKYKGTDKYKTSFFSYLDRLFLEIQLALNASLLESPAIKPVLIGIRIKSAAIYALFAAIASESTTAIASESTTAIASESTTAIASESTTAIASEPTTAIASEPTTAIASEPTTAIASEPTTAIAYKRTTFNFDINVIKDDIKKLNNVKSQWLLNSYGMLWAVEHQCLAISIINDAIVNFRQGLTDTELMELIGE
jgi:hypothetical protein